MIIHWILPAFLRDLNRDGPHPARQLNLPHLSALLPKADVVSSTNAWQACAQLLNLPAFPFAQVLAVNSGLDAKQHWLLLTPTAIQPEHRGIYLLGEKSLQLSADERTHLLNELNAWLKEDGLQLQTTQSEHWLLALPHKTDVHTTPYSQVIGCDAMTVMPTGNDALYWQAKLTEWQMFLQRSFVNQQRQAKQQVLIQALHLWGESVAKLPHSTRIKAVYTDNEAIARWITLCAGGINAYPLDALAACCDDEVMVIAAQAESHWAYGEFDAWCQYWQHLDALFSQSATHVIYADNRFCYRLLPSHRFRFWRGKKQLPKEML